jgi:NodT family efflux transporter outer membrane factor (OMF) lipoprotein
MAVAAAALLLGGCTVGSSPDSEVAAVAAMAPKGWAATKEGRAGVDRAWIARFNDRQLEGLVEQSLEQNFDLRAAAERLRQAEALARQAGASLKPQVEGSLQGSNSEQKFVGFPFGDGIPSSISDSYGSSLDVAWELDVWGRVRAGQSAAVGEAEAQGYELAAARNSLAAQIAKSWFALGEAVEQMQLARDELQVRRDAVEAVRGRFEAALQEEGGSASQLRLVQTELASAEADFAFWEGERERAGRQVEVLAGRYPAGLVEKERGMPAQPPRPPAGLPSELLLRRPDVLAAERRFASSGKRVDEARLAYYPSFRLTGSLGTSTTSLDKLLDSNFGVWSYGAGIVQPIFTGGRLKEDRRIAASRERESLAALQQTVLNAFGEVEQSLVAEDYISRRVEAVGRAAELARDAALSAAEEYAGGSGDVLTLLAALAQRIETASQLVTLRRLWLDNRVNLHLALGGDFRVRSK